MTGEIESRLREELAPELEIVRLLGRGSAASVYLAREPSLRRLVAVKVLSPKLGRDPKARLRFEREAQSAARISHPNVVAVYRVGTLSDDLPYIVLQYVRGRTLAERLEAEGILDVAEVRRILADVASGLAAAHLRRIVHRDVKPGNVLHEDETGRVFLTDFGLAASVVSGDAGSSRLTTRGHVVGDPRYRSPEQLLGEEVTELADIYGLGLLGYELLTLEGPYGTRPAAELVRAHLREEPRPLRAARPDVDPLLEDVLQRCLHKVATHRPPAMEVVRQLQESGPEPAAIPAAPYRPPDPSHPLPPPPRPGKPADVPPPSTVTRSPSEPPSEPADEVATRVSPALAPEVSPALAREVSPVVARPPRGVLRLRTLGSLDLEAADGRRLLSVLAQPKRLALLAYLAIGARRGFKRRDTLLGIFWPELEQDRARHALRQALYVLRRSIGEDVVVSRGDEEVGLDEERLWCDAAAFERAVVEGRPREALAWYAGELLPGFFLADAGEFERWLESERVRLRRLASDAAWALAEEETEAANPAAAARWGRRAFDLSPWDESSLVRLMEFLDRAGDRAGALRAYEEFADRLRSEYEAEPAPETQALLAKIRGR